MIKKVEKRTLTFNQFFKNLKLREELLEKVSKEELEIIFVPASSGKDEIGCLFKLSKAEIG